MMKLSLVTFSLLLLSSCASPKYEETFLVPVEGVAISDQERTQRVARLVGRLAGTISERDYYRGRD